MDNLKIIIYSGKEIIYERLIRVRFHADIVTNYASYYEQQVIYESGNHKRSIRFLK